MKYRHLADTKLTVSEVGFGVWSLANACYSGQFHVEPTHLLRYAVDRGINLFETADIFGFGIGEELIGHALHDERDRIVIATRFGYRFKAGESAYRWTLNQKPVFSPKIIKKACEASLKRLRTDRIDIYQVHHPDITVIERDDLYAVLEKLKKQGKVISWGAAMDTQNEWLEEAKLCLLLREVESLLVEYHFFKPDPGEELMEKVRRSSSKLILEMPPRKLFVEYTRKNSGLPFLNGSNGRSHWQSFLKYSLLESVVSSVVVDIWNEQDINEAALIGECPDFSIEEIFRIKQWLEMKKGVAQVDGYDLLPLSIRISCPEIT